MNYWMRKRIKSIDFSFEVTKRNGNIVLNEFYLDSIVYGNSPQSLIIQCDYNSNVESEIKSMMNPRIISDHEGELRVYKSSTLRECWFIPMLKYINCHRTLTTQKMFFSVTSSHIDKIVSSYI